MKNGELLKELRNGRPGAFRELVNLHQERIINTCYRLVLNRQDAEDIAQEVFLEIHRSISGFRGDAKLSTWIYRIAVTKSLDFIRRRKRKKRLATLRAMLGGGEILERLPATRGSRPDVALERRERFLVLGKALDSLPDNQRAAITLSKYRGFSQREIAEVLGTTIPAVEALIQRAKANLRRKLQRYYKKNL